MATITTTTDRQSQVKRYTTTLANNWPLWCATLNTLPEEQRKALRDDIRTMLGIDDVGMSGIAWPRYVREVICLFVS